MSHTIHLTDRELTFLQDLIAENISLAQTIAQGTLSETELKQLLDKLDIDAPEDLSPEVIHG